MALKFNKNININRVVKKLVYTILALIVGGAIMTTFGAVVTNNPTIGCSPFFSGLGLIGWTVASSVNLSAYGGSSLVNSTNCITATSSAGILSVVGIIGIASVVMEFIKF